MVNPASLGMPTQRDHFLFPQRDACGAPRFKHHSCRGNSRTSARTPASSSACRSIPSENVAYGMRYKTQLFSFSSASSPGIRHHPASGLLLEMFIHRHMRHYQPDKCLPNSTIQAKRISLGAAGAPKQSYSGTAAARHGLHRQEAPWTSLRTSTSEAPASP